MLAQSTGTVGLLDIIVVLVYLLLVAYLGWVGYRGSKTAADYMLGGRKTHPFIMSLSYGATFISTSAIVGFGGVAAKFGMSLLWLTFLNIFVGIFIAFIFLGGAVRRMGHHMDAHTFPEFIGRRYQSRFIQVFAGFIIFLFMPLYAAAVLIGGTLFIAEAFGLSYEASLLIFALVTAAYVIAGGLKGVMYTDTLQGVIMFFGMGALLVYAYYLVGGVTEGHKVLSDLKDLVPPPLAAMGHTGWTSMPAFGFGDAKYNLWWIVVSTIVMGVGIGVLAQPQLVVRFMVVKSKRELNRAALIGGIFILMMTGVAFTVGSLSNAYFSVHGKPFTGKVTKVISAEKCHAVLTLVKKNDAGQWTDVLDEKTQTPKTVPVVLDPEKPYLDEAAAGADPVGRLAQGRSISLVYAQGNSDNIIPLFITTAMPHWFGILFLLTLLAAAMSTLSSQFHTLGTGLGRDVFEQLTGGPDPARPTRTVFVVRSAIVVGLILATTIAFFSRNSDIIIARATAIFFGLCASTFLPAFVGGLFFKRVTKAAAIASMFVGFLTTTFWLLFIKAAEAGSIGLVQKVLPESLTAEACKAAGKEFVPSLLAAHPNWPVVDPLFIALPLSILTAIVVSLLTKPPAQDHVAKCFAPSKAD
ncbi:MAG: sodium:solute symporter family protein [Planctomycetota bacterium]|nr:sodium:solute symporter family protein [Planctomycetota bacterium]